MATELNMSKADQEGSGERAQVLALFRAGKSKAEIARELGTDKKTVQRMLTIAIREMVK